MKISAIVRNARERKGLSQEELANILEISSEFLGLLEKGKFNTPSNHFCSKLCRELDLDQEAIIFLANKQRRSDSIDQYLFNEEVSSDEIFDRTKDILENYKKMSEFERKELKNFLAYLIEDANRKRCFR